MHAFYCLLEAAESKWSKYLSLVLGFSSKVFLGNVLALWLQSSFLALTWEEGLQQPRTIKAMVLP